MTQRTQKIWLTQLVCLCYRAFQSGMSALLALEASVVGVNSDTYCGGSGHWSHTLEEMDCFLTLVKVLPCESSASKPHPIWHTSPVCTSLVVSK